ncbi:MAG: hypothetical protein WEB37_01360 [Bacteroidota bacterium]
MNLGLDLAVAGTVHPFAKMMTGAGGNPGALLQLFVGVPLFLLPHFQAPMIGVVLMHAAAGWILAAVFRKDFGEGSAALFLIVYWLSPWRLYNGGFLWEPSFVFLPAALHFWSCWKLKDGPAFSPSLLLGMSLAASAQMHNSSFLLFAVALAMILKKAIRIDWGGFVSGLVLGSLTLLPTVLYLIGGEGAAARESQGFLGESLLKVYPVVKGLLYWFTLGGLDVVRPLNETVFLKTSSGMLWVRFLQGLCVLSVGISLVSSWWFFKPLWRPQSGGDPKMTWWRTYALWMLLSLVAASALSPIVLQGWQVVIALHAAVIPVVLWVGQKWYKDSPVHRLGLAGYVLLQTVIVITLGLGHPIFRIPETLPPELKAQNERLLDIIPVQ